MNVCDGCIDDVMTDLKKFKLVSVFSNGAAGRIVGSTNVAADVFDLTKLSYSDKIAIHSFLSNCDNFPERIETLLKKTHVNGAYFDLSRLSDGERTELKTFIREWTGPPGSGLDG